MFPELFQGKPPHPKKCHKNGVPFFRDPPQKKDNGRFPLGFPLKNPTTETYSKKTNHPFGVHFESPRSTVMVRTLASPWLKASQRRPSGRRRLFFFLFSSQRTTSDPQVLLCWARESHARVPKVQNWFWVLAWPNSGLSAAVKEIEMFPAPSLTRSNARLREKLLVQAVAVPGSRSSGQHPCWFSYNLRLEKACNQKKHRSKKACSKLIRIRWWITTTTSETPTRRDCEEFPDDAETG